MRWCTCALRVSFNQHLIPSALPPPHCKLSVACLKTFTHTIWLEWTLLIDNGINNLSCPHTACFRNNEVKCEYSLSNFLKWIGLRRSIHVYQLLMHFTCVHTCKVHSNALCAHKWKRPKIFRTFDVYYCIGILCS